MPTYTVSTSNLALTKSKKNSIAQGITNIHSKLSQPIGWLINKISSNKIMKFKVKPNCVKPFRNKKLW